MYGVMWWSRRSWGCGCDEWMKVIAGLGNCSKEACVEFVKGKEGVAR